MTLIVVDSKKYARSNCFVSQLIKSIKSQADLEKKRIVYAELSQLRRPSRKITEAGQERTILICRQRILHRFLQNSECINSLRGLPVFVYEQDPWQAYIRDSESFGFFEDLKANLNVQNIFITSRWWSNFVAKQEDVSTSFVHMWMSQKYCDVGIDIRNRQIRIGFKGTMYNHRLQFFAKLSTLGIHVEIDMKRLRYGEYLKWLSTVSVFAHDESKDFPTIFGDIPMSTGLWWKDIETASRGTFTVRNSFESESDSYSIEKIPSIFLYKKIDEVPEILEQIFEKSEDEIAHIASESVAFIKEANLWAKTANQLLGLA